MVHVPVKFWEYDILRLIGWSLSGETDIIWNVFLFRQLK